MGKTNLKNPAFLEMFRSIKVCSQLEEIDGCGSVEEKYDSGYQLLIADEIVV